MWIKYTAAFIGALMLAGCQKMEEETIIEESPACYTLIVEASKDTDTRALSRDGKTLNTYWRTGEQVAVYLGGTKLGMLEATVNAQDDKKATLSGTLDSVAGLAENSVLTLLYPRANWDYTGQNGNAPSTYATISTMYDFATASVTVASVDDVNMTVTTTGNASFANQQSIYRFGFKIGGEGDQIAFRGFTVSSVNDALVRTRTWGGDGWTDNPGSISVTPSYGTFTLSYVSLRNTRVGSGNGDTYSFSVIDSDYALYLGSKTIPSEVMDVQGKYISAQSISVTKSDMAKSGTTTEVW